MTPRLVEGIGVFLEPSDAALLAVAERAIVTDHAHRARAAGVAMPAGLEGLLRVLRELAGSDQLPIGSDSFRSLAGGGCPGDGDVVTVARAAELKGTTERGVITALHKRRIRGYQRGPGATWQVDRASLSEWTPRRGRAS